MSFVAKKKTKSRKTTRSYNNQTRQNKSEAVSKVIIQTLVALLVKNKGGDVPFKELSVKSKIPLRTIFRLFKDKQALHDATDAYLSQIIAASMGELTKFDFLEFSKNTFSVYDRNEPLVIAYLFSSFGRQARDILRQRFNRLLLEQIQKERAVPLTPASRDKLAFAVSLVSAKIWYDMKTDFGFSGEKIGELVQWAQRLMLEDLERS